MKQLDRKITILYRWWKCDESQINEEHLEELDNLANERINEMSDYTSGELHATIDDIEYTGWWAKTTETL